MFTVQLTCDVETSTHKLKLKEYFYGQNVIPIDQKNFGKSNLYPLKNRNMELETHTNFLINIHITNEKSKKEQFFI